MVKKDIDCQSLISYYINDCALLMTAADNFFWTFELAESYYKLALVNLVEVYISKNREE